MQAGRLLLGTGALGADHGQPVPSWGNTVVVGDRWRQWWQTNAGHPRGFRQNQVMRRHPPAKADYLSRDRRLIDYTSPASGKPYYGLGFHSHSRHPFIREGRIAAYETSPAFDYVAGDMTNAWRSQDVRSAYRQIVFVRPNVFVMYDRVRRGPEGGPVRWISATGPELSLGENGRFTIGNKDARLAGRFLMPRGVRVQQHDAWSDSGYSGFRWNTRQRILEARPADAADEGGGPVEFLTVMRTGTGEEPALLVTREIKDGAVKVRLTVGKDGEERTVSVAFDRSGSPAGRIRIEGGGQRIDRELAEEAEDTYDRWKEDPRWERWTSDPRFRFMRIGEED
jgi:hypothetical protein